MAMAIASPQEMQQVRSGPFSPSFFFFFFYLRSRLLPLHISCVGACVRSCFCGDSPPIPSPCVKQGRSPWRRSLLLPMPRKEGTLVQQLEEIRRHLPPNACTAPCSQLGSAWTSGLL